MLHWLYSPDRKIKRFVEENIKPKAAAPHDPYIKHLMEMAAYHGMRPSDINSLAEELNPALLIKPKNETDRYKVLTYMMEVLLDDLNLDGAEKDFLKDFAVEIGYPLATTPFVIREIYNGMKNEVTELEIQEAVGEILATAA